MGHNLPDAIPKNYHQTIRWFPNPIALGEAVHGSQRKEHTQSIRPYLTYTAASIDLLQELH